MHVSLHKKRPLRVLLSDVYRISNVPAGFGKLPTIKHFTRGHRVTRRG
jgi:hypothetical protein